MDTPFKKLGLAVTFSPNGKALLKEARRLQELFGSELVLIHVGEKSGEIEKRLNEMAVSAGLSSYKIKWGTGDPADAITDRAKEEKIDLLIAGALEKENLITYYIGSVARKIMRNAPFSVLIMTNPSQAPDRLGTFCVSVDFSPESEYSVKKAYQFARLDKAEELVLIREFQVPGLAMTVQDSGSTRQTEELMKQWKLEEEIKMKMFVKELNLTGIDIKTVCLYGKQGWEANNYVHEIKGDIFVLPAPKKKLKLLDRVFQHDIEFVFKQLPGALLLIRKQE